MSAKREHPEQADSLARAQCQPARAGLFAHRMRRSRGSAVLRAAAHRRGFTLIEVLAALVLIGIVLPIAMQGVSMALAGASNARHSVEAAALAESKLNDLVVTGNWQLGQLQGDFGTEAPDYRWAASVTWHDGVDNLAELDVDVTWTARGKEHSATVSTLVYAVTQ